MCLSQEQYFHVANQYVEFLYVVLISCFTVTEGRELLKFTGKTHTITISDNKLKFPAENNNFISATYKPESEIEYDKDDATIDVKKIERKTQSAIMVNSDKILLMVFIVFVVVTRM